MGKTPFYQILPGQPILFIRKYLVPVYPALRCSPISTPNLPAMIPWVDNGSGRNSLLKVAAVAIPLKRLFNFKNRFFKYHEKEAVVGAFRVSQNASLVIDGVSDDQPLENYWALRGEMKLVQKIAQLDPSLVIPPNFSLFTDVPRHDNLYNLKRIVLCWQEFMEVGIPTALFLNARTDRDWQRWTDFIQAREDVTILACEFATGGKNLIESELYAKKLLEIARRVERPLVLVIRGGTKHLTKLIPAFQSVIVLDTTPFLKTIKRQRLNITPTGELKTEAVFTLTKQPLDDLLQHNVEVRQNWILKKRQQVKKLNDNGYHQNRILGSFSPKYNQPLAPNHSSNAG